MLFANYYGLFCAKITFKLVLLGQISETAHTITFIFSMHSLYFSYSRWKKLEKLKFALKVGTHSKSTVMIKRLPKQVLTHSGALERYFDQACPGQVEGVRVALGVHDLIVNVRQQKAIYRKLNNLRVSNPWLTDANNYGANKEEVCLTML